MQQYPCTGSMVEGASIENDTVATPAKRAGQPCQMVLARSGVKVRRGRGVAFSGLGRTGTLDSSRRSLQPIGLRFRRRAVDDAQGACGHVDRRACGNAFAGNYQLSALRSDRFVVPADS